MSPDTWKTIDGFLEGWDKVRPISSNYIEREQTHRLSFSRENHYQETLGGDSCSGFRCHASNPSYKVDRSNLKLYRFDVSAKGIQLQTKDTKLSAIFTKCVDGENDDFSRTSADYASFFDMDEIKKSVKSLADTIFIHLEMSGHIISSSIDDEEKQTQFMNEITNVLAHSEKRRFSQIVSDFFKQSIPESLLQAVEDTKRTDQRFINWLLADGNEQHQKYRLQIVQSYPLFAKVFTDDHENHRRYYHDDYGFLFTGRSRELSEEEQEAKRKREQISKKYKNDKQRLLESIDNAQPITDILGHCLIKGKTLSNRTIKNLGKIEEYPEGLDYNEFLDSLFYLDDLDSNWHPKSSKEFFDFIQCVKRAKIFSRLLERPTLDILKKTKGQWSKWKDKTISLQAVKDVKDWMDELQKAVVLPHILSQASNDLIQGLTDNDKFSEITGERSYYATDKIKRFFDARERGFASILDGISETDILSCSLRWHSQGETYSARKQSLGIVNLNDIDDWSSLSEPVTSPEGLLIKPLTSKQELDEEGKAMGNCVGYGGYDAKCLTKHDHILSVSENGKRLSTVQVKEVFNKAGQVTRLDIVQNQGNDKKRTEKAVQWYIRELFGNSAMAPDWEEIESNRVENRKHAAKQGLASYFGFDPLVRVYREQSFKNFSAYMPSRFRSKSYADFVALPKISEFLLFENTHLAKNLTEAGFKIQVQNLKSTIENDQIIGSDSPMPRVDLAQEVKQPSIIKRLTRALGL